MSRLADIEEIIADAKAGRMFILVDDEDRENEGDLVIPASACDAAAVNFMAKYGRGLICLALEKKQIDRLGLPLMARQNSSRHETAFTISIEAREGVTTGISAGDRARTIAVASDPAANAQDIATPGHVFPLVARDGGVLVRAGHTEAAVDIARLAGLPPAGVICEIMKDDGSMARLPDLLEFAVEHGLKVATIADLIAWRRRSERLVQRSLSSDFQSRYGGGWKLHVYTNTVEYAEHLALVKGDPAARPAPLVRMHALDVLGDVLGDASGGGRLEAAMQRIAQEKDGVLVLLREPRRTGLSDAIRRKSGELPPAGAQLRDYGIGAQILLDLGIRKMRLLTSSPKSIVGLEGYGLSVEGYEPL